MKIYLNAFMAMVLLAVNPVGIQAQCASNMGFENGNFGSWSTSTDSNFITPASRVYYNPGLSPIVVNYGSTDAWLGTISQANLTVGSKLIRVGNRGLLATADTVYRTYIVDSLSDKLTIYSKGVVELAHNYFGVPIIEAPGFGYEVYINGVKLDCLKGAFFCGNVDTPYVWNVGSYKDSLSIRKTVGWAKEELNFACFVGDTIEVRLFTRDCIKLGHYAYAYFDIVCGDTTKPAITQIMVNDIIDADKLELYCSDSTKLYLAPNTTVCPIFRGNISWSPASYVFGPTNLDSAIFHNLDSMWIYAEASFTNFCDVLNVRDSILIELNNSDPHDNIPKMPRNFCDCGMDTLDFSTSTITSIKDQNGNTMTLNNGALIIQPCDKFYQETFWKDPSAKIVTNNSQIGTVGWTSGNVEGAIGHDSILVTGTVRYVINQTASKKFFVGITTNNTNNSNDMDHAIYFNGGAISAYYKGSLKASLGTFTGTVTVDFRTLSNSRVEIWINGIKRHTYTNSQKAVFPVFPDFAAQSNDTNLINKTYLYGPTKNIKDFTRLLLPTTFKYFISYNDRCGMPANDTIEIIPGFTSGVTPSNVTICGLNEISITVNSIGSTFVDEVISTSDGDGAMTVSDSTIYYIPATPDYANSPISVYIMAKSGKCVNSDTAYFTINEPPASDAGSDISSPPAFYNIGGAPSGSCGTCGSIVYAWTPKVALNDSTLANPTVNSSLVNSNFFALRVHDPTTGCFSMDTANILAPLPINEVVIESTCIKNDRLTFTWLLNPSVEMYSFGIEYSLDNGSNWTSMGKITADLNIVSNEPKEYTMTIDKIMDKEVLYRWYTYDLHGDTKSVIPIYDVDCQTRNSYSVFPNPFSNALSLDIQANTPNKSPINVILFNEYGQKVYEKTIGPGLEPNLNQFYLNGTEALIDGIYYMNVTSNDKILYKTKIIKLN